MQVIKHDFVIIFVLGTVTSSSLLLRHALLLAGLARSQGMVMSSTMLLVRLVSLGRHRLLPIATLGSRRLRLLVQTHVQVLCAFFLCRAMYAVQMRRRRHLLWIVCDQRHRVLVGRGAAYGLQVLLAGDLRYLLGALKPLLDNPGTAAILNTISIAPVVILIII